MKTQSTSVYMWGNSVQKDWGEKKMEGVEVVDGLGYFYIEVAMQSKTCILKTHYRCGWRHPFESFHRSWPRASTGLCPPVLWGLSWQVDLNFLNWHIQAHSSTYIYPHTNWHIQAHSGIYIYPHKHWHIQAHTYIDTNIDLKTSLSWDDLLEQVAASIVCENVHLSMDPFYLFLRGLLLCVSTV